MEKDRAAELAGLLGVLVALIIGLHQIGGVPGLAVDWSRPIDWVQTTSPELVVGSLMRQVGLVIGYWVLGTTLAYAGARGIGLPARWVRALSLPVARRLVDRTAATSLTISLLGTPMVPALATDPTVVFEPSSDGIPVPHVRVIEAAPTDESTQATPAPLTEPLATVAPPKPSQTAPSFVTPAADHLVVSGDNLRTIAARHVEDRLGPNPETRLVSGYWLGLIEANRGTLRSGDPNLIYPGELIILPPIGDMP